jgi:hypothetical protein
VHRWERYSANGRVCLDCGASQAITIAEEMESALAAERALSDALAEALLSSLNLESDALYGARLRAERLALVGQGDATDGDTFVKWHGDKARAALAHYDAARQEG